MSENTSNIGIPEISFTANNEPDNESFTWNKRPAVPSTVNTPEPLPRSAKAFLDPVIVVEPDTVKEPVIAALAFTLNP